MWKWLLSALICASPASAAEWYVAPSGTGTTCSSSNPCEPQSAVERCYATNNPRRVCTIYFADGLYRLSGQIGINLYYHFTVVLQGNCENPTAVELQQTTNGSAVIYVQDFHIAGISCIKISAAAGNVTGIAGRQHVIMDLDQITFGGMGTQISLTEFAKASCVGPMTIAGDAAIHAGVSMNSQYNLLCPYMLEGSPEFTYFVSATDFSIIDASSFSFVGDSAGAKCNQVRSVIYGVERLPGSGSCGATNTVAPSENLP